MHIQLTPFISSSSNALRNEDAPHGDSLLLGRVEDSLLAREAARLPSGASLPEKKNVQPWRGRLHSQAALRAYHSIKAVEI